MQLAQVQTPVVLVLLLDNLLYLVPAHVLLLVRQDYVLDFLNVVVLHGREVERSGNNLLLSAQMAVGLAESLRSLLLAPFRTYS